jgi:uncharacterized protein (TIGR01777 family)
VRFVISGASGYLGRMLRADLARDGHEVVRLVRVPPRSPDESRWDPSAGVVDREVLAGADVVVNVSGANIGRPWTPSYKRVLLSSRVDTMGTLARALATLERPPLFVSQSAVGYYGDAGDRELDESAPAGSTYAARMAAAWEAAAAPAVEAGVRVVVLRTGVVLGRSAIAFQALALPFRLGLGGRFGSGSQYFASVGLADWLGAVRFLIARPDAEGAYNVTLPTPPTNAEVTAAFGALLRRPTFLTVPGLPVRLAVGDLADELLGSRRVLPRRLLDAGYEFIAPDVTSAIRAALGR